MGAREGRFRTLLLLSAGLCSVSGWAAPKAGIEQVPGSSVIQGRVHATETCGKGESQIWISRGSTLLYQATVMAGTTFEFHVMPGVHEVIVTQQDGCFSQKQLALGEDEVASAEMVLKPIAEHKPASRKPGRSPASAGLCPYCGFADNFQSVPRIGPGASGGLAAGPFGMAPWWMPYGMMSYSNFFYPGAWSGWGLHTPYYPGWGPGIMNGGAVMGKPNVYIEAPKGTEVKVSVKFADKTNLLAAVPFHGKKGWSARVEGPYQLKTDGSDLAFLFYDYRFNPKSLQDEAGFCVAADQLMPRLTATLRESGFSAYEIKDFQGYWQYKMPRADEYCVYPQDSRQLDSLARLNIEPKPAQVIRLGLMVVPRPGQSVGAKAAFKPIAFQKKPMKEWKPEVQRKPASAETGVVVREWGVGFLRADDRAESAR